MENATYRELSPPARVLMGPGPSNIHPLVQQALAAPLLGHLDPEFVKIMDDVVALLRDTFQTSNELTLPVSGTGSAGMEAALCNFIERGDAVVVGVNGYFGDRMVQVAERYGAEVIRVDAEWGRIIDPQDIENALKSRSNVKLVAVVHAETSTGVQQPIEAISKRAHDYGALMVVDTVTSLGGIDVPVDKWGVDICYSGTQKCLSCPPGLAPITVNPRARKTIAERKSKVQNWYLDLSLVEQYWGSARAYHHTAPISMVYALREALRLVREEGLEARFRRHEKNGRALQAGLSALGLELHAQDGYRLSTLTSVRIPEGVDDLKVRRALLGNYSIEIGGGLGPLKGKIWRIGLMGYTSTRSNIVLLLSALEDVLRAEGLKIKPGAGAQAATELL